MKRAVRTIALAVMALGMTGCLGVASPVIGIVFTDNVGFGGSAKGKLGTKEGRACAESFFALYARGDASIEAAAKSGGISNVMSVDHQTRWIVLYGEYCTIVRGT